MFQILGDKYSNTGYQSVDDFVYGQSTTDGQIETFIKYVRDNQTLLNALKNKDFSDFAKHYYGKDYKSNKYDTKMLNYYNKFGDPKLK